MNFKKHISLFLATFLLFSNIGFAVSVHYCADKVASVTLNSELNASNSESNCCGSIEKESKCCKNKLVKSSEKQDQLIVKSLVTMFDFCLFDSTNSSIVFQTPFFIKKEQKTAYYCDANAPPLYLLYSQYTFYA